MILQEIHFKKGNELLYVKKETYCGKDSRGDGEEMVVVVRNGKEIVRIETHLASLVGDCLRHMGNETDFLGLRAHFE